MIKKVISLALLLAAAWPVHAATDYTPKYQLINNPDYPTNDLAVATYNLMDYGVDNTGGKDCTSTINTLLKKLNGVTGLGSIGSYRYITGGVLYIPAGRYLITGKIEVPRGVTIRGNCISTGNERMMKTIKGIGLKTAQRIIVDLRDKIVALGIAEEIPAGGTIQAPVNNEVKDEAVSALTMLGFSPAPTQKVVVQILQEHPDAPVETVVKMALKMIK